MVGAYSDAGAPVVVVHLADIQARDGWKAIQEG